MNKLSKIGVSALCGSLAAVSSANAGEMSVSGSASMTWVSLDEVTTGNPLGIATGMTFSGSGELDNGTTFTVSIAHTHKNVYSVSAISLTTPTLGTFVYDEGGGTGLDRLDDKMPTAWEESDGTGLGAGLQTVGGAGNSTDIEWTVGSDFMPEGLTLRLAYAPHPDGTKNSKKGTGGESGGAEAMNGSGWDVVVEYTGVEGFNLFGGYSEVDQVSNLGDREAMALGFTYALGGVTFGYQISHDNTPGVDAATTDAYDNNAWGVSFAVNDDLSISYGTHESTKENSNGTATGNGIDITTESKSFQVSYTMGGASLVFAQSEVDNSKYATAAANQTEGRTVALTLAF